ncbi:MAG TPA: hypothetical protein VGH28_07225 [Polyangiaceae bacterium]|jgi:hypothetical protein
MRAWRTIFLLLTVVACGGDDGNGADAAGDSAQTDATLDGGDAPFDATTDAIGDGGAPTDANDDDPYLGDATPLGDGACTTPPFANVTATCPSSINCMSDKGVQCVADASACTSIDGYNTGRVLECGTPSDCGGLFCCLNSTIAFTPGCPNSASFGADTRATNCAPSDAGCYGIRICRIDADCAGTNHKCTDTIFEVSQTNEPVHFGICY